MRVRRGVATPSFEGEAAAFLPLSSGGVESGVHDESVSLSVPSLEKERDLELRNVKDGLRRNEGTSLPLGRRIDGVSCMVGARNSKIKIPRESLTAFLDGNGAKHEVRNEMPSISLFAIREINLSCFNFGYVL